MKMKQTALLTLTGLMAAVSLTACSGFRRRKQSDRGEDRGRKRGTEHRGRKRSGKRGGRVLRGRGTPGKD